MSDAPDWMNDPDYDDEGELNVEVYNIPPGLVEAWDELTKGSVEMVKSKSVHTRKGAFLQFAQIFKAKKGEVGAGHKYIARIPTGNPKRPYRYIYKLGEGRAAAKESIKEGARFKQAEDEEAIHVKKVDGDTVTYEQGGEEKTASLSELHDKVKAAHQPALEERKKRLEERVEEAQKFGTKAYQKLMERNLKNFEESYPFVSSPWSSVAEPEDDGEEWEAPTGAAITVNEEYLPDIEFEVPDNIKKFRNPDLDKGMIGLMQHQIDAVGRIMDGFEKNGGFLLMDEPGLGKTTSAVAAIAANGGERNLIVVPASGKENLKANWTETGELYGLDVKDFNTDGPATGVSPGTYVVSYDELMDENGNLRKEFAAGFDTVTFDESHNMKNPDGTFGKVGKELQEVCDKALYLSATPFTNIQDMHYLTKLGLFANDDEFVEFVESVGGPVAKDKETGKLKVTAATTPESLARIAAVMHVDGHALRHNANLEGRTDEFTTVDASKTASGEQMAAFDKAERIMDLVKTAAPAGSKLFGIASMMHASWHRQWYESLKVPQAVEIAKKALAEGKQVALFGAFVNPSHEHLEAIHRNMEKELKENKGDKNLANAVNEIRSILDSMPQPKSGITELVKALGGPDMVSQIHGGADTDSVAEQKAFQSGQKKIMVGSSSKAGTGLSFHDTKGDAPRVQINLSTPWNAVGFLQQEGRTHRLGSKSDTTVHWLIGDSAMEKKAAGVIKTRLETFGAVTQGDIEAVKSTSDLTSWEYGDITAADTEVAAQDSSEGEAMRSRFQEYADHRLKEREETSKQLSPDGTRASEARKRARRGFEVFHNAKVEIKDGMATIQGIPGRMGKLAERAGGTYNKDTKSVQISERGLTTFASKMGYFSPDAARFEVASPTEKKRIQGGVQQRIKNAGVHAYSMKEYKSRMGSLPANVNIPDDHFIVNPKFLKNPKKKDDRLFNALSVIGAPKVRDFSEGGSVLSIPNPDHPKNAKLDFFVLSPEHMHLMNESLDRTKDSAKTASKRTVKKAMSSETLADLARKFLKAMTEDDMFELAPPGMTLKEYKHRNKVRSLSEVIKQRHKTRKKRR
jgi:hypothetical protein